ncbi:MAG: ATP-binding protein, partial [Candidatus Hodarchaeales archaeon]
CRINKLVQSQDGTIKGVAMVLGLIDKKNLILNPCRFPISFNSTLLKPEKGLISKLLSFSGENGIYLGDIVTSYDRTEPYFISPNFFERHVLCVASTGSGKSYTVGVLLEEIILKKPTTSVVLLDVHNEYWGLCVPNEGNTDTEKSSHLSPEEFIDHIVIFNKENLILADEFSLERLRRLLDLTTAQENSLTNIVKRPVSLTALRNLIQNSELNSITKENLLAKINTLINLDLFKAKSYLKNLISPGKISIIRLDEFTDDKKRQIIVNEILNQIFEEKAYSESLKKQEVILIIEEAHRFTYSNDILTKISREGRKFGLYTMLISQRPADLPSNIIANMNTLIALRIKSDKDLTKIRLMEGISTSTIETLPHLTKGEALIVGQQTKVQYPIKIKVRKRITKHIDPKLDKMPKTLPFFHPSTVQKQKELIKEEKEYPRDRISKDETNDIPDLEIFDAKDLNNLLACNHVLILHKQTGICLFETGTSMLEIDPQLVSGFLSAISGLFTELKKTGSVKNRTKYKEFVEEIVTGDKSFRIITVEGVYSITALILNRSVKYPIKLKRRMRSFVHEFETNYGSPLQSFVGVLDDFFSVKDLLDKYLGLALLGPLQINRGYNGEIPHKTIFDNISKLFDQLSTSEGIYTEEIVDTCLFNSNYNYHEILEGIIVLLQKKILIPLSSNRPFPWLLKEKIPISDYIPDEKFTNIITDNSDIEIIEPRDAITKKGITDKPFGWLQDVIKSVHENPIPDNLKVDILKRDLIFESKYRIRNDSIRIETLNLDDLEQWAEIMLKRGFNMIEQVKNPLNGPKITFSSEDAIILCSLSLLSDSTYLVIIGST